MNDDQHWRLFKATLIAAAEQKPELLAITEKLLRGYEVTYKAGYDAGRKDASKEVADMFPHPSPTVGSEKL